MPPHLHTTYYQVNKTEFLLLILSALSCTAVYFIGLFACIIYNPVVHENKTSLVLATIFVIIGGLGCVAFVLFGLFYSLRYRLIFDEQGITCRGMFSEQNLALCDITQLEWKYLKNRRKYRIDLHTPATKITMTLELLKKQPTHRNALICFLRETIPCECQIGWENFRQHIELSPQQWHLDGRNHIPVVADDEFLVTRKDILRGSRGLILICFGMMVAAYILCYQRFAARGVPNAAFPALLAFFLVGMPMLVFGAFVISWPKHGKKWKKSQRKQLVKAGRLSFVACVMSQLVLMPLFFDHPAIKHIAVIPAVTCYIIIVVLGMTMKILKVAAISDEPPEYDIPEVLRSVKSDPHSHCFLSTDVTDDTDF